METGREVAIPYTISKDVAAGVSLRRKAAVVRPVRRGRGHRSADLAFQL